MKGSIKFFALACSVLFLVSCEHKRTTDTSDVSEAKSAEALSPYGEFSSQVEWGAHLVTIGDCNVCHTPKKMTNRGPVVDSTFMLSGYHPDSPPMDIDRKEIERKMLTVTQDLTAWAGPWGVSYAANLTPAESGIGNWTEEQFFRAFREGKAKGLEGSRTLLPPMPWESFAHMTDNEIKAIFAYLKSIEPIENVVPAPLPPIASE